MKRSFALSLFVLLPQLVFAEPQSDSMPSTDEASTSKTYWQARTVEQQGDNTRQKTVKSSHPQKVNNNNLSEKQSQAAQSKSANGERQALQDHVIWVYDAWVTLKGDYDHDNYYSEFELGFDVDTHLSQADVYARIFLGDGHIFKEIHTSSVFHVHGDNSHDQFVISSELLEGFASNEYDLMIEIYDAYSHELQDVYDHNSDNDLYLLPLESSEYEYRAPSGGQVVITTEHGGTTNLLVIGFLAAVFVLRRKLSF